MEIEVNEFSPENSPKSDMTSIPPSPPRDMAPISPTEQLQVDLDEPEEAVKEEEEEETDRFNNQFYCIQTYNDR